MTGTLTVGDTLTSATVVTVKSSNATGTYIQFVNSTIPTVEVGYNATFGAYLYNDKLDSHPTLCLGMTDNVANGIVFRYSGANYNILHAGNYQNYMHNRFGTSGLIVYSSSSNEINFGGTYTANNYIFLDILQKIIDQDLLNIILGKMMQVYMGNISSHIYLLAHSRFSVYLLLHVRI